ncbi:MAG: hypothetical protein ACNA8W_23245, partial [Bradymonadaceae bacterium]
QYLAHEGRVEMSTGHFLEARALFVEALRMAETGMEEDRIFIRTDLAEAMRSLGDVAGARELDHQCYDYYRIRDMPEAHISALNLAITYVMDSQFEEAQVLCRRAIAGMKRHNLTLYISVAYLLSLACAAGLRKYSDWQSYWPTARDEFHAHRIIERDIAWAAEEAGRLARLAGWYEEARDAFQFALPIWEALGDDEAQARIKSLLAAETP